MRYLFGFVCVCALGVVPLVGCSETAGDGGDGGTAGDGGSAGDGGTGGMTGQEFPCAEQGILDAIAEGGGPHTFACNGPTSVVTKSEIVIDHDVILDGEGNLTLDGNGEHRVISIPFRAPLQSVELHGLTLTGGFSFSGSAIHSAGDLMLENCVVSGNTSEHPAWGAVTNDLGRLTITKSRVSDNATNGVTTDSLGETLISDSRIEGNTRAGVRNSSGVVTIENSIVSGNRNTGLFNGYLMTIRSSTVSQNQGERGGAIWNAGYTPDYPVHAKSPYGAEILIVNSTISGNAAAQGGALFNSGDWGEAELVHSTIAENSTTDGADIESVGGSWVSFTNSIIHGSCGFDSLSASTSNAGNIESPGNACGFDDAKDDQVNVTESQLSLRPLADNGGPTMTHALGVDSVALDWIPEVDCQVTEDQRGQPRPETGGDACDGGSFERQPEDP